MYFSCENKSATFQTATTSRNGESRLQLCGRGKSAISQQQYSLLARNWNAQQSGTWFFFSPHNSWSGVSFSLFASTMFGHFHLFSTCTVSRRRAASASSTIQRQFMILADISRRLATSSNVLLIRLCAKSGWCYVWCFVRFKSKRWWV